VGVVGGDLRQPGDGIVQAGRAVRPPRLRGFAQCFVTVGEGNIDRYSIEREGGDREPIGGARKAEEVGQQFAASLQSAAQRHAARDILQKDDADPTTGTRTYPTSIVSPNPGLEGVAASWASIRTAAERPIQMIAMTAASHRRCRSAEYDRRSGRRGAE